MVALANLIEVAFAERLDIPARRMIREMRWLGRAGWLGWLLSRWLLPPAANPFGFVWELDGELVGNASLLPVDHFPHRWVIANVAVAPGQRGKGIAGELVDASIEYAKRKGARELILQVDADNARAINLYRHRGFEATTTRTVWTAHGLSESLRSIDTGPVRERQVEEWREQWSLAKRIYPEGVIWPYPTVSSIFRPKRAARWLPTVSDRHWVWVEAGRLVGSLSLRHSSQPGVWRVVLIVEPEYQGRVEAALLAAGLRGFQGAEWGYLLEYPSNAIEAILRELGFRSERTLTWMSMSLEQRASRGEK
jgi:ribosomal protein S18 acetylase RimI-like enzyme